MTLAITYTMINHIGNPDSKMNINNNEFLDLNRRLRTMLRALGPINLKIQKSHTIIVLFFYSFK